MALGRSVPQKPPCCCIPRLRVSDDGGGGRASLASGRSEIDGVADSAGPIDSGQSSALPNEGRDNTIAGEPLVVVYWNVAGVATRNIDLFLNDLENEILWDVLILVEFSAARRELHLSGIRTNGHLICAQPYQIGKRAGAIVFHCRLRIQHAEFFSHGRAFGADFSWGGWKIRVVGGHADAGGDRVPYQKVLTTWSTSSNPPRTIESSFLERTCRNLWDREKLSTTRTFWASSSWAFAVGKGTAS